VSTTTFGTPQRILEKMAKHREILGVFDLTIQVSYGGSTGKDDRMAKQTHRCSGPASIRGIEIINPLFQTGPL
jgi:hypothetical protein